MYVYYLFLFIKYLLRCNKYLNKFEIILISQYNL